MCNFASPLTCPTLQTRHTNRPPIQAFNLSLLYSSSQFVFCKPLLFSSLLQTPVSLCTRRCTASARRTASSYAQLTVAIPNQLLSPSFSSHHLVSLLSLHHHCTLRLYQLSVSSTSTRLSPVRFRPPALLPMSVTALRGSYVRSPSSLDCTPSKLVRSSL